MAKEIEKLEATALNSLPPGMWNDGNNLYLQVSVNRVTGKVRRSWLYRYRVNGKTHDMGLGEAGQGGPSGCP